MAIQESTLTSESAEVVPVVSGYIARKMLDKTKCSTCIELLRENAVENDCYFNELSRGGFTIASKNLNDFVAFAFAVLDTTDNLLQRHRNILIRNAAQTVLKSHCRNVAFICDKHVEWELHTCSKIVVNIYYDNKQVIANDQVRKDVVTGFKKRQRSKS